MGIRERIAALGAKTITIIILGIVIAAGLALYSCSQSRQRAAQAGQNERSADATGRAGGDAGNRVDQRARENEEVGEIVDQTNEEIENAETTDAARAAVLSGLCRLSRAYCDDAGATVRPADSR